MPNYKIEKPKGAPDWFTPGIVCKVWNTPEREYRRILVWWDNQREVGDFIDSDGFDWRYAKPVERWVPEDGEIVLNVPEGRAEDALPELLFSWKSVWDNAREAYDEVYRYTDEVHEAIKAGILTVGLLREHGEKYEG